MHKIFNPKLLFGSLRTKCQNSFLPVFLWVINKRCIVLFFIYTLHGRIWEYSSNHGTVLNDWSMAGIFCYLLSRSLKETNFLSLDAAACPGPGRGQSLIIVPFVSWYFPCNPAITRTAIQTITSGRPTTNQLQDWLKTKNQITMFQSLNNSYYYHYLCCLVTIIRTGLFVSSWNTLDPLIHIPSSSSTNPKLLDVNDNTGTVILPSSSPDIHDQPWFGIFSLSISLKWETF